LVPGDVYVLLSLLAWAFCGCWPAKSHQAAPRLGESVFDGWVVFGLGWMGWLRRQRMDAGRSLRHWGWPLAVSVAGHIAVDRRLLALRCWGRAAGGPYCRLTWDSKRWQRWAVGRLALEVGGRLIVDGCGLLQFSIINNATLPGSSAKLFQHYPANRNYAYTLTADILNQLYQYLNSSTQ
jgi:hypothetical protein